MLERVVCGGPTGVDQAAPRAARAAGIPTGGWAPLGWLVETPGGKRTTTAPWLAGFGLIECPQPGFKARTVANVRDSDGTLWLGAWTTPGGAATLDACRAIDRPFLIVLTGLTRPSEVAGWIRAKGVGVLKGSLLGTERIAR
jgi:hypothetical protein